MTDRVQTQLFDLNQYVDEDSSSDWGWCDREQKSEPIVKPSAKLGGNKNLPPNSPVRGQNKPDILTPNSQVRGQNKKLPPNLEIVKVSGQSYFLTPTKPQRLRPMERTWYEIKKQKGHDYLYLRWREEDKKKSRCLGRLDALKYIES